MAQEASEKVNNWGKWGEKDERGALNYLVPEIVRKAVGTVKKGKVYSLALPMEPGKGLSKLSPRAPILIFKTLTGADYAAGTRSPGGRVSMCSDYLCTSIHNTTTHIDGLCHVGFDGQIYNGISTNTIRSSGARYCDIAKMEWLVARGIMLDIAKFKGVDILEKGYKITVEDLEGCAKREGVEPRRGDALLVRTGWIRKAFDGSAEEFYSGCPGIGLDSAKWVGKIGMCSVASDNWVMECEPYDAQPDNPFIPVHAELLCNQGTYVIELINLEELAQDEVYEFLFVVAPLLLVGASGSPINPLAIV